MTPCTDNIFEQQRDKLFMVLALIGLKPDLDSVRDHILTSPAILTPKEVSAMLVVCPRAYHLACILYIYFY